MLFNGKAPGVDVIRPEMLKALDIVGLSWLTRLFNVAWSLGTAPVVVVYIFDQMVCSNYWVLCQESLFQGAGNEASVHMCFMDLEKAYDCVPCGIL